MVFTSQIFVFYFLPVVLSAYYLVPGKRNWILLFAGYVFYGWWNPWYTPLLLAVTLINYIGGTVIARAGQNEKQKYRALLFSLIASLGILGFFKYFTFFQENLNGLLHLGGLPPLPLLPITQPLGISFYIFLNISYPISLYLETAAPARSFFDFAAYASLFPMQTMGPITRYPDIAEQLYQRNHTWEKFASGAALFILGFAKKIFLANLIGQTADAVFNAESRYTPDAWYGALAYTFQIYFDFSGYSDMAVGLGRMLGFELMRNFNAPYHADSVTDFWRRWHISLSTMLRDYVYTPLIAVGRSRSAKYLIYRNILITMLVSGLWHGANWTFILWGGSHGLMMIGDQWRKKKGFYASLPRPVKVFITFLFLLLSWVLFRSPTLNSALQFYREMFGLSTAHGGAVLLAGDLYNYGRFLIMGFCAFLVIQPRQSYEWVESITWRKSIILIILFLFSLMGMFAQSYSPFLYFQF